MLNSLKKLLRLDSSENYGELVKAGAIIVDVRSPREFIAGHAKGSINIPLDDLKNKLKDLKKEQIIITCCASGIRSASAQNYLKSLGYKHVLNAGAWYNLKHL